MSCPDVAYQLTPALLCLVAGAAFGVLAFTTKARDELLRVSNAFFCLGTVQFLYVIHSLTSGAL